MNPGIYFIRNIKNNKFYIGSAVNFNSRRSVHKHNLKKNIHHCSHLQYAWNKYGEQNFIFEKHEYVDAERLIEIEQTYLDKYYDYGINCYNTCPTAGSWFGMKHNDKTKEKLRQIRGENRANAILTNENVLEIKQLLLDGKIMLRIIAERFGVDRSVIAKIKSGERWSHIKIANENNMPNHRSLATIGQNNPMYGKITSIKTKFKMQQALKGKMIGIKNPMTKLTEEIVIAIKLELQKNELTQKQIANKFNTSQSTIAEIKSGKRWSHININGANHEIEDKYSL